MGVFSPVLVAFPFVLYVWELDNLIDDNIWHENCNFVSQETQIMPYDIFTAKEPGYKTNLGIALTTGTCFPTSAPKKEWIKGGKGGFQHVPKLSARC